MEVFWNVERVQLSIVEKDNGLASHSPAILERLYASKQDSDVNFRVQDETFAAHKIVMAACSPVFNATFSIEMKEKETNEVKIDDVEASVFGETLRFIYTGKVDIAKASAIDLLSVPDKYDIEDLKLFSQDELMKNLTVETAATHLVLADHHSTRVLKQKIMEYIGRYSAAVINTEGWKQMAKSYPILVVELYEHQNKNVLPVHINNS